MGLATHSCLAALLCLYVKVKVEVKLSLSTLQEGIEGSRGIAALILNLDTR